MATETGLDAENVLNELRATEETLTNEIRELKADKQKQMANNAVTIKMLKAGVEMEKKVKDNEGLIKEHIRKPEEVAINSKKKLKEIDKKLKQKIKELCGVKAMIEEAQNALEYVEEQGMLDEAI